MSNRPCLRLAHAQNVAAIRRQQYARLREAYQVGDVPINQLEEAELAKLDAELHLKLCELDVREEDR
jgi:hypothetical protein